MENGASILPTGTASEAAMTASERLFCIDTKIILVEFDGDGR
jgi:hypothetical protein